MAAGQNRYPIIPLPWGMREQAREYEIVINYDTVEIYITKPDSSGAVGDQRFLNLTQAIVDAMVNNPDININGMKIELPDGTFIELGDFVINTLEKLLKLDTYSYITATDDDVDNLVYVSGEVDENGNYILKSIKFDDNKITLPDASTPTIKDFAADVLEELENKAGLTEDGKIPFDQMPTFNKSSEILLEVANWVQISPLSEGFKITVPIADILATDTPTVSLNVDTVDELTLNLYQLNWSYITEGESFNGSIEFKCMTKPTIDIPVLVVYGASNTIIPDINPDLYVPKTDVGVPNGIASLTDNGKLTVEQMPSLEISAKRVLYVDEWGPDLSDGHGYIINLTINGLLETHIPQISLDINTDDADMIQALKAAWNNIAYIESFNGRLVVKASGRPTIDLPCIITYGVSDVSVPEIDPELYIPKIEKGQPNGVPTLNDLGKVSYDQLPEDIGGNPFDVTGKVLYDVDAKEYVGGLNSEIFNGDNLTTKNVATGKYSHVEGYENIISGDYSHVEGYSNTVSGNRSHAEGGDNTISENVSGAHVEGHNNTVSGNGSHAEGFINEITSDYSHAEGRNNTISGHISHAEGYYNTISGEYSHVEGYDNTVSGNRSHVEGRGNIASTENVHVQGKYNIEDTSGLLAFIIGNGIDDINRSNAFTTAWNGNTWTKGVFSQDGTPTSDKDLVTLKYVRDLGVGGSVIPTADWNNINSNGYYTSTSTALNVPNNSTGWQGEVIYTNADNQLQILTNAINTSTTTYSAFWREKKSGVWSNWTEGNPFNLMNEAKVDAKITTLSNSVSTGRAPTNHASTENTYGVANATNFGHIRMSDSYTSTASVTSGYAATPNAVRSGLATKAPTGFGLGTAASYPPNNDWYQINGNGWYMGNNADNAPGSGWYIGRATEHNGNWITLELRPFSSTSTWTELHINQSYDNSGTRSWRGWVKQDIGNTNLLTTTSKIITNAINELNSNKIDGLAKSSTEKDLNKYLNPGTYSIVDATNIASGLDNDGILMVIKSSNVPSLVQIWYPDQDDTATNQYSGYAVRTYESNTWRAWLIIKNQMQPTSHASTTTNYGLSTNTNFGHVRLNDSYTSNHNATTGGYAATPNAVRLGLATKAPTSHASSGTTYGAASTANYGHVKLQTTISNTDSLVPTSGAVVDYAPPKSHASSATTYGAASTANYGHVRLQTTLSNTDSYVPTSGAVYDQLALKAPTIKYGTTDPTSYVGAGVLYCVY